jgi:hypothetical protein
LDAVVFMRTVCAFNADPAMLKIRSNAMLIPL